MAYENLREKYYITNDDLAMMNALRRKWAFDDLMATLESGGWDGIEPTDEQVEDIIDEYIEVRVFNRPDWELELENDDMYDAIANVVGRQA